MSEGGPVLVLPGKRDPLVRVYARAKGDRCYFSVKWRSPETGDFIKRDRSTRAKAVELAESVCEELKTRREGLKVERLSSDDRRRLELARRVPIDKLGDFVREWESVSRRRTVDEWRDEWLEAGRVNWTVPTYRNYRKMSAAFARVFGGRYLDEVTPEDVDGWRRGFVKSAGDLDADDVPVDAESARKSRRTSNNYLVAIKTMFNEARRGGALPAEAATAPGRLAPYKKVLADVVKVLSVNEVSRLLGRLPVNEKLRAYVLLSVFMPFRPSDLALPRGGRSCLQWEHFRWELETPAVDLPASVAGKGRGRLIEIPAVLREWLLPIRKLSGPVSRSDASGAIRKWYATELGEGCPELSPDVFRHTVISHLLAKTRNEILWVAGQAGNSEREILNSYKSPRSEDDGELYFRLSPGLIAERESGAGGVVVDIESAVAG